MSHEFKGKVALITGAQQGIGRGMALAFAAAGADVALNWLDDKHAASEIAEAIEALGRRCYLVQADIRDLQQVERLVDETTSSLGRLDVLVNNAGVFPRREFLEMTEEDWDFVLDINLKSGAFCAQAAARKMIEAGHGGSIINISSQSIRGQDRGVHYAASKSAIIGMTRSMAMTLGKHGIRVNALAPGTVDTAQPRGGMDEQTLRNVGEALPLGRLGTAEDIADFAVFLASSKASWTTGQIYHINGGGYMG